MIRLRSFCQSKDYQQSLVQPLGGFGIDPTDNAPNPIVPQRDHFVRHDLRAQSQSVGWLGINGRPKRNFVLHVRRNRTYEDCRQTLVEFIRLDDDSGPRSSQFVRNNRQHDIAALHLQSLQS
jgi:hypothetical protein